MGLEAQTLRADDGILHSCPGNPRSRLHRSEVLRLQAGLFPACADIGNPKRNLFTHGQGQRSPQNLTTAFTHVTIEYQHVLVFPRISVWINHFFMTRVILSKRFDVVS